MTILCAAAGVLVAAVAGPVAGEQVAPGVTFTVYNLDDPNVVYVVAAERQHAQYKLKVGWPQQKRNFTSRAPTSGIAALYDNQPGRDVLAAVNASFYGSVPDIVGAAASDGEMLEQPNGGYETALVDPGHTATIVEDAAHLNGTLTFSNGVATTLHHYNRAAVAGRITAYTPTWADVNVSLPAAGLSAIVLQGVSYPMRARKEVAGVVSQIKTGTAALSNTVPSGGMILVADASYETLIQNNVAVGDRLVMRFDASSGAFNNLDLSITGIGWLVHNGTAHTANWAQYTFSSVRHPRTVLAWNDTHWFLMVVDGRSAASVGMTFSEMAAFLIDTLGATEAVNLDGGGSSTMVVDGTVRNVPSDGSERHVSNALMLVDQDTRSVFPFADSFPAPGRRSGWDDKFTYNGVTQFSPSAPNGDGHSILVVDPAGGVETTRYGDWGDTDYAVQAHVYCSYRPEVGADGFERYGIFARDSGTGAFGLSSYGGGNCYALTYDSVDGRIRAGVIVDGFLTDFLGDTPLYAPTTAWRRLRIDCFGSTIRYWVDGTVIAAVNDTTHHRGQFGIAYQEFFDDNTNMRGTRADNFSTTAVPGDFDADGDVDLTDLLYFVFCRQGPGTAYPPGHSCLNGDADGDLDLDLRDFAWLQDVFTGS